MGMTYRQSTKAGKSEGNSGCTNAAGADCCSAETAYNLADASGRGHNRKHGTPTCRVAGGRGLRDRRGNSFYRDSLRNYEFLKKKKIHFYDAGTSGGIRGALEGANFMIGGEREHFAVIEELFQRIASDQGYLYAGDAGSGHYLKMVHNGIEYGMMHTIGEGFELLQHSPYPYDNAQVAGLWNHGSVIRSWLMELAEEAFREDEKLDAVKGIMYASGEGQWTVEEAMRCNVSVPVISTALMMRYRSLYEDTFTGKVVASLRKGFGGHKTAE